jgi:hypothetical protein
MRTPVCPSYASHRFPAEIISHAVWLYFPLLSLSSLDIHLLPLPSYSSDLMAVEPLWRWLREDVTYHHCHATAEELIHHVAAFEADVNADPCAVADRLWVRDHLDPRRRNYGSQTRRGLELDAV